MQSSQPNCGGCMKETVAQIDMNMSFCWGMNVCQLMFGQRTIKITRAGQNKILNLPSLIQNNLLKQQDEGLKIFNGNLVLASLPFLNCFSFYKICRF